MHDTIVVELFGSYGARHSHFSVDFSARKSPKDPLGPLARLLIKEGFDPDTRVHVVRSAASGSTPVFKRDRKLSAWAGEDWVDGQSKVAHRVKYRPFGGGGGGVNSPFEGSPVPEHG